ncbi:MAG: response regulator [Actinobacteria bacterium]|nr:response regulator [Actinomycetota bacterium]
MTASDRAGMTVLLVEDEPDVRLVVAMLLRRAGLTVLQAGDGREAIEVLEAERDAVDVVLLDVLMPVMTGPEALPVLRELVPDLPVVFYSGYDRGEVAPLLSEDPPYTSFLSKPADQDTLLAELDRAHAGRRA